MSMYTMWGSAPCSNQAGACDGRAASTYEGTGRGRRRLTELSDEIRERLGWGEDHDARVTASQAVQEFAGLSRESSLAHLLPRHLLLWARTLRTECSGDDYSDLVKLAYTRALDVADYETAVTAASELATDDAVAGRGRPEIAWAERAVLVHRLRHDWDSVPGSVRLAFAVRAAEDLDVKRALSLLANARDIPMLDDALVLTAFDVQWRILLPEHDPESLLARLDDAVASTPPRTRLGQIAAFELRADILTMCGRPEEGLQVLDRAPARASRIGRQLHDAARARVYLALGDDARALDAATKAAHAGVDMPPRTLVATQLVIALAEQRRGHHEVASDAFRAATDAAETHTVWTPFLWVDPTDLHAFTATTGVGDDVLSHVQRAIAIRKAAAATTH